MPDCAPVVKFLIPYKHYKTSGARHAFGSNSSGLFALAQQIAGGPSRAAGLGPCFWETSRGSDIWSTVLGLLRLRPTFQEPRQTGQFSLLSVHGPRAGVKSWGGGFIRREFCRAAELRIADHAAGPTPRGTMSRGIDAFRYCLGVRWLVTSRNRLCL